MKKIILFLMLLVPAAMQAQVTFIEASTGTAAITGGITINYPTTAPIVAGQLLIIHIYDESPSSTITVPSGWSNYTAHVGTETQGRQFVLYKVAAGGETGSITITVTGTLDARAGRMYKFSGNATSGTILSGSGESLRGINVSRILQPATVTATTNDLAIWLIGYGDDTAPSSGNPSGVPVVQGTGGSWSANSRFGTTQGTDAQIIMMYAQGTGSAITGAELALNDTDEWIATTWVIKAAGGTTPPPTGTVKGLPLFFY